MCSEESVATVAGRAAAAMETVVNLAKTTATATPAPKPTERSKPTPKPTAKPKVALSPTAKATPKPARTPSCDDRLYANKLQMAAAFENYHGLHDKLYAANKRSVGEATVKMLLVSDKLMHATYEETAGRSAFSSQGASPPSTPDTLLELLERAGPVLAQQA
ncbi:MAG: hypothetical protein HYU87_09895 [Chloroflexi bacterium]|nr:hypothetical protein [Chloroflexota bacterium]